MSKLIELQTRYKKAKYEPEPDCKTCNGTGEHLVTGAGTGRVANGPCMCIYVSHDNLGIARNVANNVAKRGLAKLSK